MSSLPSTTLTRNWSAFTRRPRQTGSRRWSRCDRAFIAASDRSRPAWRMG